MPSLESQCDTYRREASYGRATTTGRKNGLKKTQLRSTREQLLLEAHSKRELVCSYFCFGGRGWESGLLIHKHRTAQQALGQSLFAKMDFRQTTTEIICQFIKLIRITCGSFCKYITCHRSACLLYLHCLIWVAVQQIYCQWSRLHCAFF